MRKARKKQFPEEKILKADKHTKRWSNRGSGRIREMWIISKWHIKDGQFWVWPGYRRRVKFFKSKVDILAVGKADLRRQSGFIYQVYRCSK